MSTAQPIILIVDDEAPIREKVEFTLSADGIRSVGAATVDEVRARIAETSPDLILLDWILPGGQRSARSEEARANPGDAAARESGFRGFLSHSGL